MIISGVLDSISAGILIYTGLVELLAGDFLYNKEIKKRSVGEVRLLVLYMVLGAVAMASLGKWT
jgi:zinc transporter 1/2/3